LRYVELARAPADAVVGEAGPGRDGGAKREQRGEGDFSAIGHGNLHEHSYNELPAARFGIFGQPAKSAAGG
jgi:hypothetical protein